MRQQEKQAAAAARELLKAEASRQRKTAPAQTRKVSTSAAVRRADAASQMQKSTDGATTALEVRSTGRATPVPEQNRAGEFNAAASPTSFTDGSCFFNNSGSLFGASGPSPMSQPWRLSQSSDPATWVAVVTGGNRGIGLEICRQLASSGVLVVLTARDEEKGSRAVQELHRSGLSDVVFRQLDVANRGSITQLVEFVKAKFGKLDILVNNAAIGGTTIDPERLKELQKQNPEEDLGAFVDGYMGSLQQNYELAKECLEINFNGTKDVTDCLIPLLLLSNSGRVVNISSRVAQLKFMSNEGVIKALSDIDSLSEDKLEEVISVFLTDFKDGNLAARGWLPVASAYAASKALLNAYSRLLTKRHPSVVVCSVNPGFVRTDMNYGMGLVSAEEGAKPAVMLALRDEPGDSGLNFELFDVCEF